MPAILSGARAAEVIFLAFITFSAMTDLLRRKIYNKAALFFLTAGILANILGYSAVPLSRAFLGAAAGFVALLPFYFAGAMGPGDVKFLAVAGFFLGPSELFYGTLYGAVAGGALASALLLRRGIFRTTVGRTFEMFKSFLVTGGNIPHPPSDSLKLPYVSFLAVGFWTRFMERLIVA